jgi:hypothetical protein
MSDTESIHFSIHFLQSNMIHWCIASDGLTDGLNFMRSETSVRRCIRVHADARLTLQETETRLQQEITDLRNDLQVTRLQHSSSPTPAEGEGGESGGAAAQVPRPASPTAGEEEEKEHTTQVRPAQSGARMLTPMSFLCSPPPDGSITLS